MEIYISFQQTRYMIVQQPYSNSSNLEASMLNSKGRVLPDSFFDTQRCFEKALGRMRVSRLGTSTLIMKY